MTDLSRKTTEFIRFDKDWKISLTEKFHLKKFTYLGEFAKLNSREFAKISDIKVILILHYFILIVQFLSSFCWQKHFSLRI